MDLTEGTFEEKNSRAKKMMLWFGIGSLIMSFAGLVSAVIVSSSRPDWLKEFQLPDAFIISTIIIILSSISLVLAKKALRANDRQKNIIMAISYSYARYCFYLQSIFWVWTNYSIGL
jgi:cytochrome c oxidase subunit 3